MQNVFPMKGDTVGIISMQLSLKGFYSAGFGTLESLLSLYSLFEISVKFIKYLFFFKFDLLEGLLS